MTNSNDSNDIRKSSDKNKIIVLTLVILFIASFTGLVYYTYSVNDNKGSKTVVDLNKEGDKIRGEAVNVEAEGTVKLEHEGRKIAELEENESIVIENESISKEDIEENTSSEDDENDGGNEDDEDNGSSEDDENDGGNEDDEDNGGNEDDEDNGSNEDDEDNGSSEDDEDNGSNEDDENDGGNEDDEDNGSSEDDENDGGNEDDENDGGNEDDEDNGSNEDDEDNGSNEDDEDDGSNEDDEDDGSNEDDEDNGSNEDDENDGSNEDDEDNGSNEDDEDNGSNEDDGDTVDNSKVEISGDKSFGVLYSGSWEPITYSIASNITSYNWTIIDSKSNETIYNSNSKEMTYNFDDSGTKFIELVVEDTEGNQYKDKFNVDVKDNNILEITSKEDWSEKIDSRDNIKISDKDSIRLKYTGERNTRGDKTYNEVGFSEFSLETNRIEFNGIGINKDISEDTIINLNVDMLNDENELVFENSFKLDSDKKFFEFSRYPEPTANNLEFDLEMATESPVKTPVLDNIYLYGSYINDPRLTDALIHVVNSNEWLDYSKKDNIKISQSRNSIYPKTTGQESEYVTKNFNHKPALLDRFASNFELNDGNVEVGVITSSSEIQGFNWDQAQKFTLSQGKQDYSIEDDEYNTVNTKIGLRIETPENGTKPEIFNLRLHGETFDVVVDNSINPQVSQYLFEQVDPAIDYANEGDSILIAEGQSRSSNKYNSFTLDKNGITLKQSDIDGVPIFKGKSTISARDTLINNLEFRNPTGYDLSITGDYNSVNNSVFKGDQSLYTETVSDGDFGAINIEGKQNKINNNTFKNIESVGIELFSSKFNTIRNNTFKNVFDIKVESRGFFGSITIRTVPSKAIYNRYSLFNPTYRQTIEKNTFINSTDYSILDAGGSVITDNIVRNGNDEEAIRVSYNEDATLRNNVIKNVKGVGIRLTTGADNFTVTNSNIENVGETGIRLDSAAGENVIRNNKINNSGKDGILTSDGNSSVFGNDVRKSQRYGINIQSSRDYERICSIRPSCDDPEELRSWIYSIEEGWSEYESSENIQIMDNQISLSGNNGEYIKGSQKVDKFSADSIEADFSLDGGSITIGLIFSEDPIQSFNWSKAKVINLETNKNVYDIDDLKYNTKYINIAVRMQNGNNPNLSNLIIKGDTVDIENIQVDNNRVIENGFGIGVINTSGKNSITNNIVRHNRGHGISVSGSKNINISDNSIKSNGVDKTGNILPESELPVDKTVGVHIIKSQLNRVSQNIIKRNRNSNIRVSTGDNNIITENKIKESYSTGVKILTDQKNTLLNNSIVDNNNAGVLYNQLDKLKYNASRNWWGSSNGPSNSQYEGVQQNNEIIVSPWCIDRYCTEYSNESQNIDIDVNQILIEEGKGVINSGKVESGNNIRFISIVEGKENIKGVTWSINGEEKQTNDLSMSHIFTSQGTYDVTLQISNSRGQAKQKTVTLDVVSPSF